MDPSNSFESQAYVNANQPEQIETITCMDRDFYNAAAEGKIKVFKGITDQSLDFLLTPNKNTVLHIYITTLSKQLDSTTNFVEEILKMCPSLLRQANVKGETPLHIAARYGHATIVAVLIKYCVQTLHQDLEDGIEPVKKMLRMTNKERDTALHEAVRYNHLKVVELLIKEDPDFSYSANDAGETLLYIAAERWFKDMLFEILEKCKSPMYVGPLGRTALHAAIMSNSAVMTSRILEKIEGISRKVDNNGWTSLHLAAYLGHYDLTTMLLNKDRDVAYMKDTKGRTALHIAAQRGNVFAMKSIVSCCPDCCEMVDNRGWNVLHFAIKGGSDYLEDIIKIIMENSSHSNLLNEKNADGDAPLLYCSIYSLHSIKKFVCHPRVDTMTFNKRNLNTADMVLSDRVLSLKKWNEYVDQLGCLAPRRVIIYKDDSTKPEDKDGNKDKKDEEKRSTLRKAAEAHLVVAALITTVTFAACITMPGGFVGKEDLHPGSALLRRSFAFKAFVIMDTISMMLSSSVVFIHLLMPFLLDKYSDEEHRDNLLFLAFWLILGAMVTMGLAFITGTYVVLVPSSDLAIANCLIGLTFFAIFLHVILKFNKFRGNALYPPKVYSLL